MNIQVPISQSEERASPLFHSAVKGDKKYIAIYTYIFLQFHFRNTLPSQFLSYSFFFSIFCFRNQMWVQSNNTNYAI